MDTSPRIREARVAGMFYPRDRESLYESIDGMLAAVTPSSGGIGLDGILAPHAGYPYSGATAAHAFASLDRNRVTTAVIVGPSHVEAFSFTSVFDGDAYDTPLGRIRVDTDMAARIVDAHDNIRFAPNGHQQPHLPRGEHAIEVELPFLQRLLPDVTIVPVIMGNQDWDHCDALAGAIAASRSNTTIVVASSDLSHFYTDPRARELDNEFCRLLQQADAKALHEAVRDGRCEACGIGPVSVMLLSGASPPDRRSELLAQTNSSETTGDRSSVVGYAAAAFYDTRVSQ